MNSDEIIKVLNDLCEKFGIAVDWSSKNVLPYLQELSNKIVAYELWTSIAWIVIGIMPFIIMMIFCKKMIKRKELENDWDTKDYTDTYYTYVTVFWISVVCSLFSSILIIIQIFDIITCLTFPEKIIFEQCLSIYNSYGK